MNEIINRFPYFLLPIIQQYYNAETSPEKKSKLRSLITVNIGDPDSLLRVLGVLAKEQSAPTIPTSFDSIDSFLDKHGVHASDDVVIDKTEKIEETSVGPTPNPVEIKPYFSEEIEDKTESPQSLPHIDLSDFSDLFTSNSSQVDIIEPITYNIEDLEKTEISDQIIPPPIPSTPITPKTQKLSKNQKTKNPNNPTTDSLKNPKTLTTPKTPPKPDPELQKLIKNHQYSEALKIIEQRNLINPEKNIYFAHQSRFLTKLIELQNN